MPDQQRRVPQNHTPTTSSSSNSTVDDQTMLGNQTINDIITAQNNPTGQRELNPNKNGIVFMGLNGFSKFLFCNKSQNVKVLQIYF